MYKLSKYTVFYETEKGALVYNLKNGAQVFIKKEMMSNDFYLLKQGCCDDIKNEILKTVFCIKDDENELETVMTTFYKNMYDPTNLSFIIMPNNICNFSCIYCYQSHDKKYMSEKVIENFITAIKNYYYEQGLKNFYIEWFGGEPMMSFEIIKTITNELNEFFKNKKINFHYGMTTNGSLLDENKLDFLMNNNFDFFQITLDGGRNTHNKNRPYCNGKPSWEDIFNNLILMKKYENIDFRVNIRVNYNLETSETINELLNEISNKLDKRFTIFFHTIDKWGGVNDDRLETLEGSLAAVALKMFMDEAVKMGIGPMGNYYHFNPFGHVCYAGKPYFFTLGTDGLLRKCNEEDEKNDVFNVVGSINSGRIELDFDKWCKFISPTTNGVLEDKCKDCKFLPICYGLSCPKSLVKNGIRSCPETFKIIDEILMNKYDFINRGNRIS